MNISQAPDVYVGMRWMGVIAVCVAVSACNTSSGLTWHGDETFTVEERAKVEAGAAFISAHTDTHIRIVFDAPHDLDTCPELVVRKTPGVGGEYMGGESWCISLGSDEPVPGFLAALTAHEFGHWLAMEHVKHGVMQPFGMTLDWTDEDEAECERVRRCDLRR